MAHTSVLAWSTVRSTGRPELAPADTRYVEPPTVASDGAVDVKETLCACGPCTGSCTSNANCTAAAGAQASFPACSARIVHVPAATVRTFAPVRVQVSGVR